jgi:hypothetical protein
MDSHHDSSKATCFFNGKSTVFIVGDFYLVTPKGHCLEELAASVHVHFWSQCLMCWSEF